MTQPAARGPHILLYGLFGIGNTGNDATLEVTLDYLRRAIPDARFTIVGTNPDVVLERFPPPAVALKPASYVAGAWPEPLRRVAREIDRWLKVSAVLADSDCLIVPGTGILDDFGVGAEHAYRVWMWTRLAKTHGVPVMFVSIGAGPVAGAWSRRLFARAAALAAHRSYRDVASRDFARDVFKIDVSRDVVTPDLVFGLGGSVSPVTAPIRTVGLGVMKYHSWNGAEGSSDDIYASYLDNFVEIGAGLLARGLEIVLLMGEPGDEPAARAVQERLSARFPEARLVLAPVRSLHDVQAAVLQCQAVIATRYHNLVAAMMCGRPVVSIGYGFKNKQAMAGFGLDQYCQDVNDFTAETALAQFDAATTELAAESARIVSKARAFREAVLAHLSEVSTCIKLRERG